MRCVFGNAVGGGGAHTNDKLAAWNGSRRSRRRSTACRQTSSNGLYSGSTGASRSDGTSNWIAIPLLAGSIFFLRKLRGNAGRASFVSGLRRDEVRRNPAILGALPCSARRRSEAGCQELPIMAAGPKPSISSFSSPARQPGPLHGSRWRPLSGTRTPGLSDSHVGLDWHPCGV